MSKFVKIKVWEGNSGKTETEALINIDNITEVRKLDDYIVIYFGMNRWNYSNMSIDDFYKLIDNRYTR